MTGEEQLIREARKRGDVARELASLARVDGDERTVQLSEAAVFDALADALEARLGEQDQLREAIRQAHGWIDDALESRGQTDDEMLKEPGVEAARLISARDTLKAALAGGGGAA